MAVGNIQFVAIVDFRLNLTFHIVPQLIIAFSEVVAGYSAIVKLKCSMSRQLVLAKSAIIFESEFDKTALW